MRTGSRALVVGPGLGRATRRRGRPGGSRRGGRAGGRRRRRAHRAGRRRRSPRRRRPSGPRGAHPPRRRVRPARGQPAGADRLAAARALAAGDRRGRPAQGPDHGRGRPGRRACWSRPPATPAWPPPAPATCSPASSARCWPSGLAPLRGGGRRRLPPRPGRRPRLAPRPGAPATCRRPAPDRVIDHAPGGPCPATSPVRDVMTTEVADVRARRARHDAMRAWSTASVDGAPVVDADGRSSACCPPAT